MQEKDNLSKLQDIQKALADIAESGTFTITMKGTDTVLSELIKIGTQVYESINPKLFISDIQKISYEIDTLRASMAKAFGVSKEDVGQIQKTLALSYQNVIDMGGSVNDIAKIQKNITDSLNTNLIASTENVNDLFATYQITNVSPDRLISGFREVGFSMSHIKDEMQKVVDYSHSVGVNTQEVAKRVSDNLGKMNLFNFEGGVQGLSKMAAQSALLGINMDTAFKLAEDLLDPQKAIDLSASLQRLGVTSSQLLDPLRAMDLAQNDPAELQNQLVELSKQFVRTKEDGSFEILPGAKRQMREIETALGMSRGELSKMALQSAEVSKKMSEIRFPAGLEATEEQKQTIANLAQFNKLTGKYEISLGLDESGKEIKRAIDELPSGSKELQGLLDQAQKKTPIEDLAKSQLSELMKINSEGIKIRYAGRIETAAAQGDVIVRAATKEMTDMAKKITEARPTPEKSFESAYAGTTKMREELAKPGGNISLDDIMKLTEGVVDSYVANTGKAFEGLIKDLGEKINKYGGPNDLGDGLIKLSEHMGKLTEGLTKLDFEKLKSIFENDLVKNIIDGIQKAFTKLTSSDALIDVKNNVVHQFDEGDITAFVQKDKVNNTISNENNNISENKEQVVDKMMIKEPTINIDLLPLSAVMSKMVESNNQVTSNIPSRTDNRMISDINLEKYLLERQRYTIENESQTNTQSYVNKQTEDIGKMFDFNISKLIPIPQMGLIDTDSNKSEFVTPIVSTPSIPKIENLSQTHEHKFSDIKISLSVDIPNLPNANVSTEQIKSVLEQTVNSHDFKQQLAIKINQASTNDGLTAQGGTANYGAQKTNYSLG